MGGRYSGPAVAALAGRVAANKTSAQVAITMDLTATILAATSTLNPANHPLDGINLLPSLRGRSSPFERRLFWRRLRPSVQRAVRSGRWKLLQDGVNFYLFDV